MPDFVFATCRAGAEPALKREVAVRHGDFLTPAFMRPQLITWKARVPLDEAFELGSIFAAVSGRSVGPARSVEDVAALVSGMGTRPTRLHVFPRVSPEDGLDAAAWVKLDKVRDEILKAAPESFAGQGAPVREGEIVLDVIVGDNDEAWFVGSHSHSVSAHPDAGALTRKVVTPQAPSRAWLKMEQALAWAGLDQQGALKGKIALELGCAPGGSSYSLLQHGAEVIGVDTGAMDERVLNFPGFTHVAMAAGDFQQTILPQHIDILVSDMNLEPNLVLNYVEFLCEQLEPRLLILTLKINDAGVEKQMPLLLKRLQHFAPKPVRAKQLPANRRDLCVVAGRLR